MRGGWVKLYPTWPPLTKGREQRKNMCHDMMKNQSLAAVEFRKIHKYAGAIMLTADY